MIIMNTKIKAAAIVISVLFIGYILKQNKEIVCHTCDNGYPISNLFLNSCPEEWSVEDNDNPCTK